jgi:hypothetical protein
MDDLLIDRIRPRLRQGIGQLAESWPWVLDPENAMEGLVWIFHLTASKSSYLLASLTRFELVFSP